MTDDGDLSTNGAVNFLTVVGGGVIIGAIAFGLGHLVKAPLADVFAWRIDDFLKGLIGAMPLVAFLYWFVQTDQPAFAKLREQQLEFFAGIGFELTVFKIVLISVSAGVFEEWLFRGVLQVWADRHVPLAAALILTNILFGVLHWQSALYALLAGILGVYLGIVFVVTENLLAPMVAHGAYNLAAMMLTRQILDSRHGDAPSKEDADSQPRD